MTADVRQQLTEALDEAERIARAAVHRKKPADGIWRQVDAEREHGLIVSMAGEVVTYHEGAPTAEQAVHIARWDPATVLRLVAHFRDMLVRHEVCTGCAPDRLLGGAIEHVPSCHRCGDRHPCTEIEAAAAFWVGTPEVKG